MKKKKVDYSKTHDFWVEVEVFNHDLNEDVFDEQCFAIDTIADKYNASIDVDDIDHVGVRFMKTDYTFQDALSFLEEVRRACYKVRATYYHRPRHLDDIYVDL